VGVGGDGGVLGLGGCGFGHGLCPFNNCVRY
jgi:hypothetical protein